MGAHARDMLGPLPYGPKGSCFCLASLLIGKKIRVYSTFKVCATFQLLAEVGKLLSSCVHAASTYPVT